MTLEENSNTNLDGAQGQKAKVSALAILAFALSIMSIASIFLSYHLVLYVAISAIIIGCIALILNGRRQEKVRGKSMAVIGLVISLIWIVSLSTFLVYVMPLVYEVKQNAQFFYICGAIELFNSEFDGYPPSNTLDEDGRSYCGAMKLCEALVGRDLKGFHTNSKFRADGLDESGASLYDTNTLEDRKGPYVPEASSNPYLIKDLYGDLGPFDGNEYVLCDIFRQVTHDGTKKEIGMPILYYKANKSKTAHDVNDPDNPENIYNYNDNHALLALGVPGNPDKKHPLYQNPKIFYEMTRNYRSTKTNKPQRADTYILLSAGRDGLYGTEDDIPNFAMQWKSK
jgi:hypothetical protein